ncbi:hypothetical protein RND81_03G087700 [Saponaria officinalis]|uniref:Disease resistance protein RPM1 n=1 Tax=Saponaria officinalis TaxID=3572 RepID=A0AAW1M3U6_SAPOF
MGDIYGATQVVLQTLGALVNAEVSLHSDLRNDVNAIQYQLENILGYLINAEEKAEGNAADKEWVRRVRELAYDMEDVIERYQLYLKKSFFSKVGHYFLREVSNMASTIKSLRENATSIAEASNRFRYPRTNVIAQGQCNNQVILNTSVFERTIKRGNEVVIDAIAKREIIDLIGFQNVTGAPSTAAVVGMRGLGKTTVVCSVYYDDTIRSRFPLRAWISMSECKQQIAILRSVIVHFSNATDKLYRKDTVVNMDESLLLDLLQNYIQNERFMVVIDNVQEGDIELRTHIKGLLHNERGSKIIITTRYKDVARTWLDGTTNGMYILKPLPFEKAWELFCGKAIQSSRGRCPSQLEKLARGIVKKCGGLPPVIISAGILLCTKGDDLNEWNKVHHSLEFFLDMNRQLSEIHKTFMRSYYELPFYIKPCFLYFGLFPRGYPISRMRLIRLWMAEGFIRESSERLTLEEVAEEYINKLIHMSMIDVISRDSSGKIKTLGVENKFIHEMILSKLDELSFCKILSKKGSFGKETSRRLSIHKNCNSNAPELANLTKTSLSIRSLFVENVEQIIMVNVFDKTFLHSIELLKVLDLFSAPIDFIPTEVGTLLNLHYLSLRSTRVSSIPKTIGNIEKLQTLDLKQTFISELPKELIQLHNLRHILAYYYWYDISFSAHCMKVNGVKIPNGLLENCLQLQKLAVLDLNAEHRNWERELRKLTQLRKLGITGLKSNEGQAMCSVIDVMNNLQAFKILSQSKNESIDLTKVKSPPLMLQRLYLSGHLLSFPIWICQLHSLVKIRLRWSKLNGDPLQMLQELPNLVELQLLEAFTGERLKIASHGFQKLKILSLLDLHPLRSLYIARGALPLLDEMSIGESKNLGVPSSIQYLSTLTTLNFYNMPSYFTDHILPGKFYYSVVKHIPSVLFHNKDSKGNLQTFTLR